jgi:hypothetical protein
VIHRSQTGPSLAQWARPGHMAFEFNTLTGLIVT